MAYQGDPIRSYSFDTLLTCGIAHSHCHILYLWNSRQYCSDAIIFASLGLIWMPFFKTYDKQLVDAETAEIESDSDDDWSF